MPKVKQFDEKEVLLKARSVFWQKGYNGTSMDELVRATGLSRSSIYDTFGDKHGLFLRSVQLYQQDQLELLSEFLQKGSSPKKKIQLLFQLTVSEILQDSEGKGCFLVNVLTELGCTDKEVMGMACSQMEKVEETLYVWIKEGQEAGEISPRFSPRALARNLQTCLSGLRIRGQATPDKTVLEDIAKVALSLLDQ